MTECKNYRGVSLCMVGKIYVGILVDRVCRVNGGLIDDEQGSFRAGKGCVDQIFTLKRIGEKAKEKKRRLYVGIIDLEEYNRINREGLCQVFKMYDVLGVGGFNVLSRIKSMYVDRTGYGDCVIWPLRVVLCLKIGDLL